MRDAANHLAWPSSRPTLQPPLWRELIADWLSGARSFCTWKHRAPPEPVPVSPGVESARTMVAAGSVNWASGYARLVLVSSAFRLIPIGRRPRFAQSCAYQPSRV